MESDLRAFIINAPEEIPPKPRELIGRDDDLKAVLGLLDENKKVLLQGLGGSGKTALAATVVADRIKDNKGPILWLTAGTADAEAVLTAIALALAENLADPAQTLTSRLSASGIKLLVLDDVWNTEVLKRILEIMPRELGLLVTSRYQFALDAIIRLDDLAPDEALELLCYYANHDYSHNAKAQDLCGVLGYSAAAVEVAGKRLKVGDLQPQDLLEQIGANTAAHVENHSGVTALIESSLLMLDEQAKNIFAAFGQIELPDSLVNRLAKHTGLDEMTIFQKLDELAKRGLVERIERVDYKLHDLALSYVSGDRIDLKVFLSYSRKDSEIMRHIEHDLRAKNLRVWTDEELQPGTEAWAREIEKALDNAGALVAILSPDAKDSRWVGQEIMYAIVHNIRIFPILIRGAEKESIPFSLAAAQWIDLRDEASHRHEINKLADLLRAELRNVLVQRSIQPPAH